jgi:hypothetical protein
MFDMVLAQIEKVEPRTAARFPENPGGYAAPLQDALQETLETDLDFAAALKMRMETYQEAAHACAEAQAWIDEQGLTALREVVANRV